jgi:hypothetical protein
MLSSFYTNVNNEQLRERQRGKDREREKDRRRYGRRSGEIAKPKERLASKKQKEQGRGTNGARKTQK